jgi:hypothetical protein
MHKYVHHQNDIRSAVATEVVLRRTPGDNQPN